MALTNHDRVGKALELLKSGLAPFVAREMKAAIDSNAVGLDKVRGFADDPMLRDKPIEQWDVAALLKLMWDTWNEVFRKTLGHSERNLVSEVRTRRDRCTHQQPFSSDDVQPEPASQCPSGLCLEGSELTSEETPRSLLRPLVPGLLVDPTKL